MGTSTAGMPCGCSFSRWLEPEENIYWSIGLCWEHSLAVKAEMTAAVNKLSEVLNERLKLSD